MVKNRSPVGPSNSSATRMADGNFMVAPETRTRQHEQRLAFEFLYTG
jgi:hypothetical protein